MFGASQLWGKVGRAFLKPISERQCWKFPPDQEFKLDKPLIESLRQWPKLIDRGPPRPVVGGVLSDRRLHAPRQFAAVVPEEVKARWLSRSTQFMPIDLIAPVVALLAFADRVRSYHFVH